MLPGGEAVVVVEGLLEELLDPEDERLAGQDPQHVRQVALPEGAHPFLLPHAQQAVPQAVVALLEEPALHQLGHHLHPEADQVQWVGERDGARDE